MSDMQNSALLNDIFKYAEMLCKEKKCSDLTRDYLIVAAIIVMDRAIAAGQTTSEEHARTQKLLANLSRDQAVLDDILKKWQEKEIPYIERLLLSSHKGKAQSAAIQTHKPLLTADIYLAELLTDRTPSLDLLRKKAAESDQAPAPAAGHTETETKRTHAEKGNAPENMSGLIRKAKALQTTLQDIVLGQEQAVSVFASGYFQSELQAMTEKDRKRPRATFLFAGPPGVGKTFLSEEAANILGLPFRRFDMSEYNNNLSAEELTGTDEKYRGSSEGSLTGFVKRNPQCVLLFDEIEKADLAVIHLFLQILDAGRLRDNRTDEDVSFKDTILIFTTNAGKTLYENDQQGKLSSLSRDVILDTLAKDINPRTGEPFFPAAICSRFASGNVIMFNRLEADSLRLIVEKDLSRRMEDVRGKMNIQVDADDKLATALLLAEGASADARTVKSRADSFFGGELYELFRLLSSKESKADIDKIRTIHFTVNIEGEPENVRKLFSPAEKIHALAYSKEEFSPEAEDLRIPVMHYAQSPDEAEKILCTEQIQLVFCDLFNDVSAEESGFLNLEDRDSPARDLFLALRSKHPSIPIVLLEPKGRHFSDEEKVSYQRGGASGFLSLEQEGLEERIGRFTERIFQQNCMMELARSNRVLHFETAQRINDAGDTADILLFDMKLEKAIKAEDRSNVLSMLSTPDVKFDDVIGAEDAKKELIFFVNYMQSPQRYRRQGVSSPKGVLLYGPPGTGKTMLAKAFAAESHATFIATVGSRFFQMYMGQGKEMLMNMFATARRYAPAVIFIDEIDTIARERTGGDGSAAARDVEAILTALLSQMDGFSTSGDKPVFVLGATNYSVEPDAALRLDPAVLRRFDRRILVDLPTLENRKLFLKTEIEKKPIFHVSDEGIASLADRSTGMSLALLSSALDMAVRMAVQNQEEFVTDQILEEAFETFVSGEARERSRETTLRTARHEAGHALVSWLAGEKPSYITIVSRGNYGGYMQRSSQEERTGYTRQELLAMIRISLGGRAAEMVYYGKEDGLSTGVSSDLKKATDLAQQLLCRYGMDDEFGLAVIDKPGDQVAGLIQTRVNELLREQLDRAIREITDQKEKMDALVDKLMELNCLRAHEIAGILGDAAK